jgi:hypothetical protein
MMTFVTICSTCSVDELKTRFETWNTRNDVNGVNLFLLSYLVTLMAYLSSQWAPNAQTKYFTLGYSIYIPFVLNRGWKRNSLQMMILVNVCSTCSVVELKTRFETRITRNDVNGKNYFILSYLITLIAYLCSQWAQNILITYFMFDWSIYTLLVLNSVWKRDFLQMIIIVNICSTCSVVEWKRDLKFE